MGQRLFRQARADFASAERNLRPGDYFVASYLAHQAAEKALKAAVWHLWAEEPPWTHDLRACAARAADIAGSLPEALEQAIVVLNPLYTESRYPSGDVDEPVPVDLIGLEVARRGILAAREVLTWVEQLLQRPVRPRRRSRS